MSIRPIRVAPWTLLAAAVLAAVPARGEWVDEPSSSPAGAPSRAPASQASYRPVGFLVRMGIDGGGDELANVQWTSGDSTKISAGGLITFAAGVLVHPAAPWALEATIGYKFDKANASNGTIEFTRVPVDVILSYANSGHRLGAGATVHLSPTFRCDVDGMCNDSVTFNTAMGGIVQYAYGWGRSHGFEIGVRGTFIHYSAAGLPTFNGSSVGLILGGWL